MGLGKQALGGLGKSPRQGVSGLELEPAGQARRVRERPSQGGCPAPVRREAPEAGAAGDTCGALGSLVLGQSSGLRGLGMGSVRMSGGSKSQLGLGRGTWEGPPSCGLPAYRRYGLEWVPALCLPRSL